MYFKAPLLEVDSQRSTSSHKFKVAIALIGGSCLVLLGFMASSAINTKPHGDLATSLVGMPTSLRKPPMTPMTPVTLPNLPSASPWKEMTIAAIEANNRCDRDVSLKALLEKQVASLSSENKEVVAKATAAAKVSARELLKAGQTAPLGYWDPAGLAVDKSEGKILFYREAEVTHGRLCMLAFVGINVGELYHPLFGGNTDTMAAHHFTMVPEQLGYNGFWFLAWIQFMVATAWEEIRVRAPVVEGRTFTGLNPNNNPESWVAVKGRIPGDYGFDPLGLKPTNEKDLIEMQTKELNNGRLAMFAVIGIIGQEMATDEKVFQLGNNPLAQKLR